AAAAEAGGDETKAQAERLFAILESAIRLALQDVLVAAAEEITCELAPGSVEVRLRGRDPEFVVTPAPDAAEGLSNSGTDGDGIDWTSGGVELGSSAGDEGGTARINLRMPEHLKLRVEQAATREGLSVNSWLVRAAAAALERTGPSHLPHPHEGRSQQSSKRFTGWAR
ncbi:MAG: hypothetical protein ACLP6E_07055, partial [Acidimicrobiales bacterium]